MRGWVPSSKGMLKQIDFLCSKRSGHKDHAFFRQDVGFMMEPEILARDLHIVFRLYVSAIRMAGAIDGFSQVTICENFVFFQIDFEPLYFIGGIYFQLFFIEKRNMYNICQYLYQVR